MQFKKVTHKDLRPFAAEAAAFNAAWAPTEVTMDDLLEASYDMVDSDGDHDVRAPTESAVVIPPPPPPALPHQMRCSYVDVARRAACNFLSTNM